MHIDGEEAPRITLKERQRLERQELILQATEQVFAEKGYRDTSMDEIAARVGIGTATIYLHYRSKEELMVAAIIERDLKNVTQHIKEISESEGRALEKLKVIFHDMAASGFFRRRVNIFYSSANSPEMQEAISAHENRMKDCTLTLQNELYALMEQGKTEGDIQITHATDALIRAFLALVRSQNTLDSLLLVSETSANALLQIFLQGIITHPGMTEDE